MPLRAVLPFLEGGLRSAGEQRRNSTVVRSLRRAENLQVREELIRCKQRCGSSSLPQSGSTHTVFWYINKLNQHDVLSNRPTISSNVHAPPRSRVRAHACCC